MRVARAERWVVRWPLADDGRGGAASGRWRARWGVVLALHADGTRGLGEASPLPGHGSDDGALARVEAELERLARALPLHLDPARPWATVVDLTADLREPAARFAVETAALDLLGQRARLPLAALLAGGAAGPVPAARVIDDAAAATAALAAGFTTLKVKVGAAETELARLTTIRAAAPDAHLRLDVNGGWPLAEVARRLTALTPLGPEYVEEPAAGLAPLLAEPRPCPLALDESLADPARERWLDRALAGGAVATLVLKPTVVGGLAAALTLAAHARAHGVDAVASHALEGPLATAACAELARALGGVRAHGVDDHAALAAWGWRPRQLAGATLVAAGAGLGLGDDERRALDLALARLVVPR